MTSSLAWIGPEAGHFAVRMAKGAVEVGCRVAFEPGRDPDGELLDRSWRWVVEIDGRIVYSAREPQAAGWRAGRPITEAEYQTLRSIPDHQRAQVIDLRTARPGVY